MRAEMVGGARADSGRAAAAAVARRMEKTGIRVLKGLNKVNNIIAENLKDITGSLPCPPIPKQPQSNQNEQTKTGAVHSSPRPPSPTPPSPRGGGRPPVRHPAATPPPTPPPSPRPSHRRLATLPENPMFHLTFNSIIMDLASMTECNDEIMKPMFDRCLKALLMQIEDPTLILYLGSGPACGAAELSPEPRDGGGGGGAGGLRSGRHPRRFTIPSPSLHPSSLHPLIGALRERRMSPGEVAARLDAIAADLASPGGSPSHKPRNATASPTGWVPPLPLPSTFPPWRDGGLKVEIGNDVARGGAPADLVTSPPSKLRPSNELRPLSSPKKAQ